MISASYELERIRDSKGSMFELFLATRIMRSMVREAGGSRRRDMSEAGEHGRHHDQMHSEKQAHGVSGME